MSGLPESDQMIKSLSALSFDDFKANLLSGLKPIDYKNEDDIYSFIKQSLEQGNKLSDLVNEYKDILLNEMRWDNKSNKIYAISSRSMILNQTLYDISVIYNKFKPVEEKARFFNFECLLNNFKIKLVYHFNNLKTKLPVDIMIEFIKTYLEENLLNGVRIALEGITNLKFEEAVDNFILEIIKIFKNILKNHILGNNEFIMKIFEFNNFLSQEYGTNSKLYDIIPKQQIQEWIKFEIQLINQYYIKNFNKTQYQLGDGENLNKYLSNLFDYFKPFLVLEIDASTKYILQFKIMIFQKIILQILESYRAGIDVNYRLSENVLMPGSLLNLSERTKSGVLMEYSYLNLQKNIILIYDNLLKLSKNRTIILMNQNFNDLLNDDNEGMKSLLQGELIEYKKIIVKNFNNMVLPFIKKTSRENLSQYINIGWHNISSKEMYDSQTWSLFLEANDNLLSICKDIFIGSVEERSTSLDILLHSQYDKLKTVNNSMIIKSAVNNILLAFKMSIDQELVINTLLKDLSSLNIEPDTLIEWLKFKDYTRLISLLIYKDLNKDLLKFNNTDESIFRLQKMYQIESLSIQEVQKVWNIYM